MARIAIIGLHDLYRMQFLYKYTEILDEAGIDYDVICWNRIPERSFYNRSFSGNKLEFSCVMENQQPKLKKIPGYLKCIRYAKKMIEKNQYDSFILLTTQTALPLYLFSRRVRKSAFIYDYRDITFEKYHVCLWIIRHMIRRSAFTAMSSLGYMNVVGTSKKIVLSHNEQNIKPALFRNAKKNKFEVIRLAYWGGIRQLEFVKRVCDFFGNDQRFILTYYGEGSIDELSSYCASKEYKQIYFTGRYTPDQVNSFAQNTDVLINLYENDEKQALANTVKLYDGIRYGLPMLVTQGSYMAETMRENQAVFCLDIDRMCADDVYQWYKNLSHEAYPYTSELEKIRKDDLTFQKALLEFCESESR